MLTWMRDHLVPVDHIDHKAIDRLAGVIPYLRANASRAANTAGNVNTALWAGDLLCRRNGMRNEERYPANLSVAAIRARLFGGSVALWPPSAVMMSSASGHARCSAQALSMGQTTS
jgi:hypothetical protein